jgi:uncharacterized repeat protein (TIGR01451 family)
MAAGLALLGLVVLLMLSGVASAFAAGNGLNWRNEGLSASAGWTTGEIGPYNEGDLVPFRLTVTNPSTKPAVVGGFSLQVTAENHDVAVFDYTTDWNGPLAPDSQDGLVDGWLRTTFPAGLTLAPGASATFYFKGHLAESAAGKPAAGMVNGNGVVGFSEVDAAGVGAAGKRVPVKVNARTGLLGTPAVDIVKTSDAPATGVRPGTNVHYSFVVTNIGDVTLTNATVTDAALGEIGIIASPLAPGESITLTSEAVANETYTSVATVLAYDALGRPATGTSELTVSVITSARIFGSAFEDWNANGAWDADEPAAVGREIDLVDQDGNLLASTLSDANGFYEFKDLTPGTTYALVQAVAPPFMTSCPGAGYYLITPTAGQDCGPYDFGAALFGEV